MMMMFRKVRPIAPHILSSLNTTDTCYMVLLLTILALWHFRVHVHNPDHCDISSYVKLMVDYGLYILTHLGILNINLYDSHV